MTQFLYSQKNIYIDEVGDTIRKGKYYKKWKKKKLLLSAWHYKDEHGTKYHTLKKNLYLKGTYNYGEIKSKIEELTKYKIPDSSVLLISYRFKDDYCVPSPINNITKDEISKRKEHLSNLQNKMSKKGAFYLSLFENGIVLHNEANEKQEYYFNDNDNFFKEKFFVNPALCGAFALIKTNGNYIVRNGEYRSDWMLDHLKPENWKLFFNDTD
ncbi:hypothetical protein [Lacinutrix chionoecetis]